jgi:hypothetical protein
MYQVMILPLEVGPQILGAMAAAEEATATGLPQVKQLSTLLRQRTVAEMTETKRCTPCIASITDPPVSPGNAAMLAPSLSEVFGCQLDYSGRICDVQNTRAVWKDGDAIYSHAGISDWQTDEIRKFGSSRQLSSCVTGICSAVCYFAYIRLGIQPGYYRRMRDVTNEQYSSMFWIEIAGQKHIWFIPVPVNIKYNSGY